MARKKAAAEKKGNAGLTPAQKGALTRKANAEKKAQLLAEAKKAQKDATTKARHAKGCNAGEPAQGKTTRKRARSPEAPEDNATNKRKSGKRSTAPKELDLPFVIPNTNDEDDGRYAQPKTSSHSKAAKQRSQRKKSKVTHGSDDESTDSEDSVKYISDRADRERALNKESGDDSNSDEDVDSNSVSADVEGDDIWDTDGMPVKSTAAGHGGNDEPAPFKKTTKPQMEQFNIATPHWKTPRPRELSASPAFQGHSSHEEAAGIEMAGGEGAESTQTDDPTPAHEMAPAAKSKPRARPTAFMRPNDVDASVGTQGSPGGGEGRQPPGDGTRDMTSRRDAPQALRLATPAGIVDRTPPPPVNPPMRTASQTQGSQRCGGSGSERPRQRGEHNAAPAKESRPGAGAKRSPVDIGAAPTASQPVIQQGPTAGSSLVNFGADAEDEAHSTDSDGKTLAKDEEETKPLTGNEDLGPTGWPLWTDVTLPSSGEKMKIRDQTSPIVQKAISITNKIEMPRFMCFDSAFPLADRRPFLLAAAVARSAKSIGPTADFIAKRVESDDEYAAGISVIPEYRMSNFRGKVKDLADSGVKAGYKFSRFPDNKFSETIGKLLKEHSYIYPGNPLTEVYEEGRPYCHEAIIEVLRGVLFGAKPLVKFSRENFLNKSGKPQMPQSLVALAATAEQAALKVYQLGETAVKIDFDSNIFETTFSVHMETLEELREEDEEVYQMIMEHLYEQASGASTRSMARSGGSKIREGFMASGKH
ncbi:hypothetical protein BV25DRAFT_1919490 [Artomyces pyxidatus]|uniref:Uncharacterized protein n=1 Tax=Artomyces pyxidatus TaxID=48021 RepID=A0ACB8SQP8_9AGAM|nr:hypothetical protein BV25DRAFT_1919490 [Artomyces pyxidatus]